MLDTPTQLSTKIRYGREKKPTYIAVPDGNGGYKAQRVRASPRNTLVTISDGTTIWWGISRCNLADKFDKDLGVQIALGRAETVRARNLVTSKEPVRVLVEGDEGVKLVMTEDGLSGVCLVESAETLVKYFEAATFKGKPRKKETATATLVTEDITTTARVAHS